MEIYMAIISDFSDNGLLDLHNAIREALIDDDNNPKDQKKYNVRGTKDWKSWAEALENEMTSRGIIFQDIPW